MLTSAYIPGIEVYGGKIGILSQKVPVYDQHTEDVLIFFHTRQQECEWQDPA